MKRCSRCHDLKPLDEFDQSRKAKDGRYCYCRACRSGYQKAWRLEHGDRVRAQGRARYAANPEAGRQQSKAWRDRHREHLGHLWKARRRKVTLAAYGLTSGEYEQRLADQAGACAVCRSTDPQHWSGRFQVDHDHQTNVVRGLLCAPCNGGLGLLDDDPKRLIAALAYLVGAPDITAQIAAAGFYRAS